MDPSGLLDGTTMGVLGFVLVTGSVLVNKLIDMISNMIKNRKDEPIPLTSGEQTLKDGIDHVKETTDKMLEMHSKTDNDGVYVWYFPQKIRGDLIETLDRIRDMEEKQRDICRSLALHAESTDKASKKINDSNEADASATLQLADAVKELTMQYSLVIERLKDIKDSLKG